MKKDIYCQFNEYRALYCIFLFLLTIALLVNLNFSMAYAKNIEAMRSRVNNFKTIYKFSKWLGIPVALPVCVQIRETGWLPKHRRASAISPAGAIGLMQIMPYHAKTYGYKSSDLLDPDINIEVSCKLLKVWYLKYDKDLEKVFAAYNGGDGQARVIWWKRCQETRNYVILAMRDYEKFTN